MVVFSLLRLLVAVVACCCCSVILSFVNGPVSLPHFLSTTVDLSRLSNRLETHTAERGATGIQRDTHTHRNHRSKGNDR